MCCDNAEAEESNQNGGDAPSPWRGMQGKQVLKEELIEDGRAGEICCRRHICLADGCSACSLVEGGCSANELGD